MVFWIGLIVFRLILVFRVFELLEVVVLDMGLLFFFRELIFSWKRLFWVGKREVFFKGMVSILLMGGLLVRFLLGDFGVSLRVLYKVYVMFIRKKEENVVS